MRKFGWSLPPGVTTLPGEEDYPCEICGEFEENCICPECPVCGEIGDPLCYKKHGLVRTVEQANNLLKREKEWEEANRLENECWDQYAEADSILSEE